MWIITIVVLVGVGCFFYYKNSKTKNIPNLPEIFWGPEENRDASKEIRPFVIDVPGSIIDDLNERLAKRIKLVSSFENTAWTYGTNTNSLEKVLEYWHKKYNWTERQTLLNKYPQYITNVQGLDIHFYHIKPHISTEQKNIKVLPLLLLHGWPGSVVEFQKIFPLLTSPHPDKDFVFEVIAPSLPGYAFSQAAVRPGLSPAQMSVIFKNLMLRLGFDKFYAQGGDWGSVIVKHLAELFPNNILGIHVNMCMNFSKSNVLLRLIGAFIPSLIVEKEHYNLMYPLKKHLSFLLKESGYFHIQATKPDTIGTAVAASPVGLAAYIIEKFSTGTNGKYKFRADGGLLEKYTMDELLDNIMLYWITNSFTTSVRIYSEFFGNVTLRLMNLPVTVPMGYAVFPHEISYEPRSLLRHKFTNLVHLNYMPRGGHFAAFEEPVLLTKDVFEFVSTVEKIRKKIENNEM
ncbi:juvenile hormone epoxide hydrolase 2-like [Pseudomyrmex gracilis]|uniref:juvenile hormone epoxide hydrolase 2-like n=1 Tax=Pseudomyrmex gracilis TaxID=219809 RepID=UPI000995B123|nr:juvenile hormone epoxide hydrolase 2-like [Pseudomyrmex gracilis]